LCIARNWVRLSHKRVSSPPHRISMVRFKQAASLANSWGRETEGTPAYIMSRRALSARPGSRRNVQRAVPRPLSASSSGPHARDEGVGADAERFALPGQLDDGAQDVLCSPPGVVRPLWG
jgi:hypothetical protein